MGLPVPGGGPSWPDGGFLWEPAARRKRGKAFLRQAMKPPRIATKITLDAYAASPRAVADWKQAGELPKRVKYLNHLIEPDHGRVKQRLGRMLGLKSFGTAGVVIRGIELAEKIKKGQYKMGRLAGSKATTPEIWQAARAA